LLTKCKEVLFPLDNKVKECIKEMRNTIDNVEGFYGGNTIGVSANQLGYDYQIMIISKYPGNPKLKNKYFDIIINPSIMNKSIEESIFWEGCISDVKYKNFK
jgi:peptide deformylase